MKFVLIFAPHRGCDRGVCRAGNGGHGSALFVSVCVGSFRSLVAATILCRFCYVVITGGGQLEWCIFFIC